MLSETQVALDVIKNSQGIDKNVDFPFEVSTNSGKMRVKSSLQKWFGSSKEEEEEGIVNLS